jgi:hypothetical protein
MPARRRRRQTANVQRRLVVVRQCLRGGIARDRADCENGFDELKNQWGLSGFTTHDINRCQTTARACAQLYST